MAWRAAQDQEEAVPWVKVNGQAVHLHMDKRAAAKLKCGGCWRHTLSKGLCDWKLPEPADPNELRKNPNTCDAPCCEYCATQPAPDKHICVQHREALGEWMMA